MTKAIARRPWERSVLTTLLWLFSVWCLVALFTDTYDPVVMAQAILASRRSLFISVGLLIAVFPANIYMAVRPEEVAKRGVAADRIPRWLLWARLPLQPLMAIWVWRATASRRD